MSSYFSRIDKIQDYLYKRRYSDLLNIKLIYSNESKIKIEVYWAIWKKYRRKELPAIYIPFKKDGLFLELYKLD